MIVAGFEDYDNEDSVLARVIAESQHEYLANLKRTATTPDNVDSAAATGNSRSETSQDSGKGKSIMPKDGRH